MWKSRLEAKTLVHVKVSLDEGSAALQEQDRFQEAGLHESAPSLGRRNVTPRL